MSEPRRLSVSSHPPRKRATPAYKVRRPQRAVTAISDDALSEPDIALQASQAGAAPVAPNSDSITTQAPPGDEELPDVVEISDRLHTETERVSPDDAETLPDETSETSGTPDESGDSELADATVEVAADGEPDASEPEDHETSDYADYARSIEEAASRSRLEMAPQAAATTAFPVIQQVATQPPTMPVSSVRRARGRPVVGSRVRDGGGGGSGHPRTVNDGRERDPRPLLKRPRTWLVIFGIIVAIVAIGAVLWAANIVRITYDAYNEAHIDPPDRTIYTINDQGTPVAVPTEQVEASLPNWDTQDPFNVLLMGIDDREGDTEPPRSDTMIVMRINPATNHVVMMSIPRDLLVYIPIADRWDKMNAAYPIGEEQEKNGGPPAVMETIEANFNVRIHYFVTVDFEGFRTIVDTVGGVIIDVRAPVKDDQYPTEDFGITREYFPTGLQKMDGETALRYSRTRHGDNDIARGERQQQMLVALREQAMDLGLVTKAEELIRQMGSMVRTDFNFNQLLALANLGRSVDPNGISKVNLWDAGVLTEHIPADEFDPFFFEADWPAVYQLMDVYFSNAGSDPPPPTPTIPSGSETQTSQVAESSDVDLEIPIIVQNAADIPRLATVVSQLLNDAGFSIVSAETRTGAQEITVIYDYAESPETARYIAAQLGLDDSAIVYGNGGNGIVVELGSDVAWVLDQ